jgi:hypothetical protein
MLYLRQNRYDIALNIEEVTVLSELGRSMVIDFIPIGVVALTEALIRELTPGEPG